jgi:hypothetical protein
MNWRSKLWLLDWLVPCAFALALCLVVPLGTAFELGMDEGFEFMKGLLVSRGYPLYGEFWNDQPPLHTELLALLFRLFGPSALAGRLLSVGLATVLITALYQVARMRSGRAAGVMAVALLAASPSFLQLSVSVMLEAPAMAVAMASVWAWFRYVESNRVKWLWISGVLFGCALQVKFTAILFLPALVVDEFVARRASISKEATETEVENFSAMRGQSARGQAQSKTSRKPDGALSSLASWSAAALRRFRTESGWKAALLWCGTAIGAFLLIVCFFYRAGAFGVFFGSHFSKGTADAVNGEGYAFRPRTMLDYWDLAVPAAVGIAVIVLRRRKDLLFPVVLLLTVATIHLWHRPFWYYYQLHFSIPLAWLGAVAMAEIFRMLWEQPSAATRWGKWKFGAGLLAWSAVTSLVVTSAPVNLWNEIGPLRATVPAAEDLIVAAFKRRAAGVRWVFTNERSAAFWAGLAIPPELAVLPSKRIWSGQITKEEILRCLEKHRPELILIPSDWETKFELSGYLKEHYREDAESGVGRLLRRK